MDATFHKTHFASLVTTVIVSLTPKGTHHETVLLVFPEYLRTNLS